MKSARAIIGGEGNGGVIYSPVCWVRDSLSSMALVLSLMAETKKSISELVADLPRYAMVKKKYDLSSLGGASAVGGMLQRVAEKYNNEKLNTSDGVRVDFQDGWVHLRPSNTEPIVRLIAEAPNEQAAEQLIANAAKVAGLG
jgi:phosphomannomutase